MTDQMKQKIVDTADQMRDYIKDLEDIQKKLYRLVENLPWELDEFEDDSEARSQTEET
jgi:hypothetical protein